MGANSSYNYKVLSKEEIGNDIKSSGKLIDAIYDCVGSQNLELVIIYILNSQFIFFYKKDSFSFKPGFQMDTLWFNVWWFAQ